jgi:hypothetical protein
MVIGCSVMNFNKIVPSIFTDPQSLLQCDILESASMPWLIKAAAVCGSGSDNSEMMVTCQNLGEAPVGCSLNCISVDFF